MRRVHVCFLVGLTLVVGAGLAGRSTGESPRAAAGAAAGPNGGGTLCGAGSCAAAACHNGNGPKGTKGSEYTTWVVHDPHACAVEVLYGKRSLQIEKKRKHPPEVEEDHPERDPLCLSCHVQPGIEPIGKGGTKLRRGELYSYEDGVSCEACHGAADGWLTDHYTAEWRRHNNTPEKKKAKGMHNTKDLRLRAELCVRCHVGAGGRAIRRPDGRQRQEKRPKVPG